MPAKGLERRREDCPRVGKVGGFVRAARIAGLTLEIPTSRNRRGRAHGDLLPADGPTNSQMGQRTPRSTRRVSNADVVLGVHDVSIPTRDTGSDVGPTGDSSPRGPGRLYPLRGLARRRRDACDLSAAWTHHGLVGALTRASSDDRWSIATSISKTSGNSSTH